MTILVFPGTPAFINFAATTTPTPLPGHACHQVDIKNTSGVDVVVDRGDGTPTYTIPTDYAKVVHVRASSAELRVSVASGAATLDVEVWG